MNYLGKFIDNFRHAYKEINAATLTGAIDVVVVQQPDGTYTCSPFHVRFGKIGVLRSREKIVEIEINGEPSNIFMKLGESGEAFFVEELIEEEGIPPYMVCSPIPCSESQSDNSQEKTQDWNNECNGNQTDGLEEKTLPKTFHAKTVEEGSTRADFRPIRSVSDSESGLSYMRDDLSKIKKMDGFEDIKSAPSSTKRKRRRKMMAKRKLELESRKNNSDNVDHTILSSENVSQEDTDVNQTEDTLDDDDMNLEVIITSQSVPSIPNDLHFFSDTEVTVSTNTRQHSPVQSDTEYEITRQTESKDDSVLTDCCSSTGNIEHQSWRWGELPTPIPKSESLDIPSDPAKSNDDAQRTTLASMLGFMKRTKHMRQKSADGGIYLSELMVDDLDQDTVKKYLPYFGDAEINQNIDVEGAKNKDDDVESGNGTSLAQSPTSEVESLNAGMRDSDGNNRIEKLNVAMSLCGGLAGTDDVFDQHLITYEEFLNDPDIFKNPNVMFRIDDEICTWEKACPIILSHAAYNKPIPQEIRHRLGSNERKEKENGSLNQDDSKKTRYRRGYSSWFTWARSNRNKSQENSIDESTSQTISQTEADKLVGTAPLDSVTSSEPTPAPVVLMEGEETGSKEPSVERKMRTYSSTDSESETCVDGTSAKEKCRKSLRLSSEQIASLNLQEGSNEVAFSVTTAYQGTTRCKCTLFLWRYDDKIVISDIDGTITRSDVLGHLLPIVGNDWAQSGVAKLFNRIKENGYKLLYLSARAIGQSKGTRRYLNSIRQEDLTLPEGPLLLNPTSLLSAFHREVIEKKPEEFKISCLRDIQALFPSDSNPFYAGYGNKINDVWAYQAVGIPLFRIFTINHKGELKHELTETFQSTYLNMSQIADQMFPIRCEDNTTDGNYSQFVYWREPIPDLDLVA